MLPVLGASEAQAFHRELDVRQGDGQGVLEGAVDDERLVDLACTRHLLERRRDGVTGSSRKGDACPLCKPLSRSVLTWEALVGNVICLCLSLRFHILHMLTSLVLPDIFLRNSRCVNLTVARNPHVNYILTLSRASGLPLFQSSRAKELLEPPSYTKDTGLTKTHDPKYQGASQDQEKHIQKQAVFNT